MKVRNLCKKFYMVRFFKFLPYNPNEGGVISTSIFCNKYDNNFERKRLKNLSLSPKGLINPSADKINRVLLLFYVVVVCVLFYVVVAYTLSQYFQCSTMSSSLPSCVEFIPSLVFPGCNC